jgi:DNA-binding SARP family transcriptional activator
MAGLRAHHLPVEFSADGLAMRCHPRFREYLQQRLRARDVAAVRELRRRHGELLASEGRHDDAVGELLEARDLDGAERSGELAMPGVLRRRDFGVAARWLEAFRPEAVRRSEPLTYAELIVAMEHEEFVAGEGAADRLLAMSRTRAAGSGLDPNVAGAVSMCYVHVNRLDEAHQVIGELAPGLERDVWQFQLGVAMADDPHHYRERPEHQAFHGFLARLDLYQGRLQSVLEPSAKPWAAARSSRIEALRAVGRLDEALALLQETSESGWTASRVRQYGEIMADLKRPAEAYAAARQGRELIARSGALPAMLHHLFEAMLALRLRRDTALAAEALARVESDPTARRRLRTLEQIELWHGLMGLLDDDAARAAEHLRAAVDLMVRWDRLLLLPTAAIYLAEAEWRLDDEAAADAAADQALWAARRQGSDHLLLQALREFPSVVSRRLDAEAGTDSDWHGIGRTLMTEGLLSGAGLVPHVHVREFGAPVIVVDGREVQPKLTRSVELLAYLAAHDGPVTRGELLDELFGGRADDSARSYLRQAVNRLREVLPPDAPLAVDGAEIGWADEHLTSESIRFRSDVQQALHAQGRTRLDALVEALEVFERGEFLPGARSRWADERREDLRALAIDARLNAAEAAFDLGELEQAEEQVQRVLREDAYRESAWRLSMRIAGALGHDDRVIARFRGCQKALAELATAPAASTRQLLEQLRR